MKRNYFFGKISISFLNVFFLIFLNIFLSKIKKQFKYFVFFFKQFFFSTFFLFNFFFKTIFFSKKNVFQNVFFFKKIFFFKIFNLLHLLKSLSVL